MQNLRMKHLNKYLKDSESKAKFLHTVAGRYNKGIISYLN